MKVNDAAAHLGKQKAGQRCYQACRMLFVQFLEQPESEVSSLDNLTPVLVIIVHY